MDKIRKYAGDYETVVTEVNKITKKEIRYIGKWFVPSAPEIKKTGIRRLYITAAVLMIILFVCCGMINNAGNRNIVLAFFYAASIFPVAYNFLGMITEIKTGEKRTRREKDLSGGRMKISSYAVVVMYSIVMLSEIVSLFLTEVQINPVNEMMYFFFIIAMIFCALLVIKVCKCYPYQEEEAKDKSA